MLDYDTIDAQGQQFLAMLDLLEAGLANDDEDDRREALDYLGDKARSIGGVFNHEHIRTLTETSRDYTDGTGENRDHAATRETMQDIAVAVRNAAEPAEAALIIATVLSSVARLAQELKVWEKGSEQAAANLQTTAGGMTRDRVLAYLATRGRTIKPGTWSAYVARNQAPQATRRFGRTPLWAVADVVAFADGTWEAPRPENDIASD
jgi:hypothetical protein